jgi:Arc/MetJ-type ribon-helix-helix transcriptional regulator
MVDDSRAKMVRTSITIPLWMKLEMDNLDVNWSSVMREAIRKRLSAEKDRDLAEAVLINERLRRTSPEGWNSTEVIREWRKRR